jgi:DNA-binding NtrC family response regulator
MTQNHEARPQAARFLIVDAELGRAAELAQALADQLSPAAISIAPDGRSAAESLREERCEIVLMDFASLPDSGGSAEETVTRLVKLAQGALAIAFTDGGSVSANLAAMQAGAHECVPRSIAPGELCRRIAELATRHGKTRVLALFAARATAAPFGRELPSLARAPGQQQAILPMWQQEQRIIEDAIARCQGNVALAAAALELSPSTIYRKRQAWAEAEGKRGAA